MFKKFWDEHKAGILGTVIFHLLLLIVFFSLKIKGYRDQINTAIILDFQEVEEIEENLEHKEEMSAEEFQKWLTGNAPKNIPVNVTEQMQKQISTEDFVKEFEKELEAQRPEEYYDIQEKIDRLSEAEFQEPEEEKPENEENRIYTGPTNITYTLENRRHIDIPVPVYLCEGGGTVEVEITVNQKGYVTNANVLSPEKTSNEICFSNAAREASLNSRFNPDINAPERQRGTITFHFVAQD